MEPAELRPVRVYEVGCAACLRDGRKRKLGEVARFSDDTWRHRQWRRSSLAGLRAPAALYDTDAAMYLADGGLRRTRSAPQVAWSAPYAGRVPGGRLRCPRCGHEPPATLRDLVALARDDALDFV